MPLSDFFSCIVRRVARGKMPLHAGREHFHYMLMRGGLSGPQVLALLVAFSVFYATVGLIGASLKVADWALFAPWITLLGLQPFIIRGLAMYLRLRRWRTSKVVVKLPASGAAAHSHATQLNAGREATVKATRAELFAQTNTGPLSGVFPCIPLAQKSIRGEDSQSDRQGRI